MLLADEMGVGKTVQAIALLACYQARAPAQPGLAPSLRVCCECAGTWMHPDAPEAS